MQQLADRVKRRETPPKREEAEMLIDWVKVSEQVLAGGITLLVGLLTYLATRGFAWLSDKRRERILFELAVMRGQGVELRNQGEAGNLVGSDLTDWLEETARLENAMLSKANELSKVEGERLKWLDRVHVIRYRAITDGQQRQKLWNLSELLVRCDALLAKYRF